MIIRRIRGVFPFFIRKTIDFIHTHDLIIRMIDTKGKILNTAEELFGEFGYSATSMRQIISKAHVNLAAIHYHFGSKEDLLDQVIMRKAGPMNERRMKLLDEFEAGAAPESASIEKIIEAFVAPAILIERSPEFLKLMGRIHAEGLGHGIIQRNFQPIIDRFLSALHRALPDMAIKELAWKAHFTVGAMAFTLMAQPGMDPEAALEPPSAIIKRLVAFVSGGFRAPV
jgi:AcrR family transcriptional regulator